MCRADRAYETTAGRLQGVISGGDTFTYGYKSDAPGLIQTVTVTNAWETNRDILDRKENQFGSTVISKYDYTVNSMGRRTNLAGTGTAYSGSPTVGWDYNPRGELTLHNHSNNTWDSVYEFDNIGNRRKAAGGTTLTGPDNHTSNSLNQYTSIGGVSPSYDFAGNLTADAGGNTHSSPRTYTWDGENRPVKVTTVSGGATLATYRYDPIGRRYGKTTGGVSTWFLYDGWNMISGIINGGQQRAHLWGLDLSGTSQGAGGVGGLLSSYTSSEKYRPLYDGNGNIVQYVTSTGSIAASYEYSPFGHLLSSSGPAAPYLNFGFSTKFRDLETDFYYYGYRYYSSWMARWINRDPIGEKGGKNLYGMVGNDTINCADYLGLQSDAETFSDAVNFFIAIGKLAARTGKEIVDIADKSHDEGVEWDLTACDDKKCKSDAIQVAYERPSIGDDPISWVDHDSTADKTSPLYNSGLPAYFGDAPSGFASYAVFEVCQVCHKKGKIEKVGPCIIWRRKHGAPAGSPATNLEAASTPGGIPAVPSDVADGAPLKTPGPSSSFLAAVKYEYPGWFK